MRLALGLSFFALCACESRPLPSPVRESGPVIAKIDDVEFTAGDLENLIDRIEDKTPQVIQSFQQKRELVEQIVNVELLSEAAREAGFENSFQFKSKLADVFVEEIEKEVRSSITEEQIERFYRQNRAQFDEISARHILLRADEGTSREDRLAIIQKLEGWKDLSRGNPEQFAELARRHSEDSTAASGGELGFFNRARMVAPFSEAAFALKEIGDVSEVVRTQFGYHLIQLSGDHRGIQHHRSQIEARLSREAMQSRLQTILENLREGRDIKIFENEIQESVELPEEMKADPEEILPEDFDEKTR